MQPGLCGVQILAEALDDGDRVCRYLVKARKQPDGDDESQDAEEDLHRVHSEVSNT